MATKCRCLNQCPDGATEGICYIKPGGICFAHAEAVQYDNGTVYSEITRGCFPPDVEGMLQCKGSLSDHDIPKNITCCQNEDFCNDKSFPKIDSIAIDEMNAMFQPNPFNLKLCLTIGFSFFICLLFISFVIFIYRRRYKLKQQKTFEKERYESDDSMDKTSYHFQGNSCKPLLPVPQLDTKFGPYPNIITPRIPMPYIQMANSSASTSDSCSSTAQFKYNYLNNSHSSSHNSSHNGSNCTINHYRNFSSTASHTTSSMNSELTQQTTLSSQKLTSNGSLPPLNETSISSGSGSGIMHLVQKTLAREIVLDSTPIGIGRYGEVYYGKRRCDENVAVKIFYSREEASWKREIEIYTTVIMRHENILGFLGADVTSWNGCTQLWLVTEYHELGSLFNFLQEHPIKSPMDLLKMMMSIVSGLEHLHTEVIGTLGKPAIAHRDIKSKNILMKRDLTCCIADFGLAVTKAPNNQANMAQLNHQVGTKRYMAPEVLNETNLNYNFEFYKCADIYSLALVFWELYNRLEMTGEVSKYSLPFEKDVAKDPTFEEMRDVVCVHKKRPLLEQHMNENEFSLLLDFIRILIAECWKDNPSSRLSALYIKKKLMSYFQTHY